MPNGILEVKQIKQLSADGGGTVIDVENKTIDGVAIGTSDITVGNGKTLDVSDGTLTTSTAQKEAIVDGGKGNLTASDVGLGNVTNESKATMFTNPTLTGTTTVSQLNADNIRLDGNTISSTDTNGDINISPNGTGAVTFQKQADFDAGMTVTAGDATGIFRIKRTASDTSGDDICDVILADSNLSFIIDNDGDLDTGTYYFYKKVDGSSVLAPISASSASLDGAVVINDSGEDVDFRVESDTSTHALFVEGSSGAVLFGAASKPTGADGAIVPNSYGGIVNSAMIHKQFSAPTSAGTLTVTLTGSQLGVCLDICIWGVWNTSNREGYAVYKVICNRRTDSVVTQTVQAPTNNSGASFTTNFSFTASKPDVSTLTLVMTKPSGGVYLMDVSGSFRYYALSSVSSSFVAS